MLEELPGHVLAMRWHGFADSREFRTATDYSLQQLRLGHTRWLADLRRMGVIDPDNERMAIHEWFPQALRLGLERVAVLPSQDVFNQMAMDNILKRLRARNLIVAYYIDEEEALQWLRG